ncbi:hypothetical protein ACIGBH_40820 [Streptomyces sp. NPDC085929]|uniref:hypothetical protein n=1 Tax=Streptomyces sp. NPDC085929 TaxID=3365739 RepID=UPI0037D314F5
MDLTTRTRRRGTKLLRAGAVTLVVLASTLVQAGPAAADDSCGPPVGGAILAKYRELGSEWLLSFRA